VVGFIEYIDLYQIETSGKTEADLDDVISKAKEDASVDYAFPNQQADLYLSPLDDPVYSQGGSKGYDLVGVKGGWDLINASGRRLYDVHVGVTDDGLYKGYNEFNGKVKIDTSVPNSELSTPNTIEYGPAASHGTGVMNIICTDPANG
jgi:hypothetical protein